MVRSFKARKVRAEKTRNLLALFIKEKGLEEEYKNWKDDIKENTK